MNITNTIDKIRPIVTPFFGNTVKIIDRTWTDILKIKRIWDISSLFFKFFYIAYLVYALISGTGILYLNIAFLVFSVGYLSFDLYTRTAKAPLSKKGNNNIRRCFRYIKISLGTVKLSMAVYSVIVTWNEPSVIGVVLAVFSVIGFLFDVIFEIIYTVVTKRYRSLCEAFDLDFTKIKSKLTSGKEFARAAGTAVRFLVRPKNVSATFSCVSRVSNLTTKIIDKKSVNSALACVSHVSGLAAEIVDNVSADGSVNKKLTAVIDKIGKMRTEQKARSEEKKKQKKSSKSFKNGSKSFKNGSKSLKQRKQKRIDIYSDLC